MFSLEMGTRVLAILGKTVAKHCGQFYFELIVLHVDDMCSMNHVCIKHIITDDKDNFNRY